MPAYLTVTSNPNRTSPVKRGRFVLDNLLGAPLPPPPPNVGVIPEDAQSMAQLSLRERLEKHRSKAECASCHSAMDPLGFALENFDAIGRWRTKDGTHDIDARGALPDGTALNGVNDLRKVLLKREPELVRFMGERMLTYAIGRGMRTADRCHLDTIREQTTKNGSTFRALIKAVVTSEPFLAVSSEE
jgi:hypothetical protein